MSQGTPAPSAQSEPGRLVYKWKVLISVIFGVFMVILDSTVINVAYTALRQEFGASINDSQWIISIYVLALGISTPLAGYLADRFGLKRMYIFGLGLFVLGSFLSGISPSLPLLIAARALQGSGGGIALPLGTALLFNAFPRHEQGTALGIFGIAVLVGPATGPILGGFLVDQQLWRWIFFINLPIGLLGIFLATRFLRAEPPERKPSLNPLSLLAMVIGFGSILYATSLAANQGWTATAVIVSLAIGLIALIAYGYVELLVAREPLLDLRLFGDRTFLVATVVGYITVLALFGAEFLMPIYLQALRGYTALRTGLILLPLAITAGFTTPVAGRLYDRVGPRPLVIGGFLLLLINTWQLSQIEADTPISFILMLMALRGLALGMLVQTTLVTALSVVPGNKLARGSSLINATRFLVQSIGVAVLATVLASSLSPEIRSLQRAQDSSASSANSAGICETAASGGSPAIAATTGTAPAPPPPQVQQLMAEACTEYVAGFEQAYKLTFYLAGLAIVVALLLPGWPGPWTGRRQTTTAAVAH